MPSNWTKQLQQLNQVRYMNSGSGDSVVGGLITGVPSGVAANQGIQDVPGDRIILGMADALALSNTTIGTLYGGMYQYVRTKSTSTATPTLARAVFWDNTVNYNLYQVTPDEVTGFWAGFNINTLTKGYNWWIQVAGLITMRFLATITGTPTVGRGVLSTNLLVQPLPSPQAAHPTSASTRFSPITWEWPSPSRRTHRRLWLRNHCRASGSSVTLTPRCELTLLV